MKYSIVVPVYNMEKYVEACIKSILAQTFQDFELLLINDGSTDNSYQICLNYSKIDSRVKAIDKVNGGVSSARNLGVDLSQGEYILFVDSDDSVLPNLLETIEKVNKKGEYDLVVFGAIENWFRGDVLLKKQNASDVKSICYKKGLKNENWNYIYKSINMASIWNKVYKSKIIKNNNLKFSTNCVIYEDLKFNLDYTLYVRNFLSIDRCFYNYRLDVNYNQIYKRKFKVPFQNAKEVTLSLLKYAKKEVEGINVFYALAYNLYDIEIKNLVRLQDKKTCKGYLKKLYLEDSIYKEVLNSQKSRKKARLIKLLSKFRFYGLIIKLYTEKE